MVESDGNDQQSYRVSSHFGLLDCCGKEFRESRSVAETELPAYRKDDAVQQTRNVERNGLPARCGTAVASATIEGAISIADLQKPRALPRDLKARELAGSICRRIKIDPVGQKLGCGYGRMSMYHDASEVVVVLQEFLSYP